MPVSTTPSRESSAADEAALLSTVATGDERAFLVLYERFSGPLFSLLIKMLQNQQDAEEVLQIVFLQVWKKAGTYDPQRCSVFTWLVLVGRSKAIDRIRQRQRHSRTVEEVTREETVPAGSARDDGTSEVHQHDQHAAIRAALEQIPAEQRQAIEMAFFKGMSQTEIADNLAEPLGTVKARIRRGMLRLRDTLARRL
jgi:RNA polymerase sigma-70 factor, ECF subfamily